MPIHHLQGLTADHQSITAETPEALAAWAASASFGTGKVYVVDFAGVVITLDLPREKAGDQSKYEGSVYREPCVRVCADGEDAAGAVATFAKAFEVRASSPEEAAFAFRRLFNARLSNSIGTLGLPTVTVHAVSVVSARRHGEGEQTDHKSTYLPSVIHVTPPNNPAQVQVRVPLDLGSREENWKVEG